MPPNTLRSIPEPTPDAPKNSADAGRVLQERTRSISTRLATALGDKFDQKGIAFDVRAFQTHLTTSVERVFSNPNIPDIAKDKFAQDLIKKIDLLASVELSDIESLQKRRAIESLGVETWELRDKTEAEKQAYFLDKILTETLGKYVEPTAYGLIESFAPRKSVSSVEYSEKPLEAMFAEMGKLDREYGLLVVEELKSKWDIASWDPFMNIGARILVNFSKGQIPKGVIVSEEEKSNILSHRKTTTPTRIIDQYRSILAKFQSTEREIRSTRNTATDQGFVSWARDTIGINQLTSEFDHLKPENIEEKIKKASLADMVIIATQLAQLAPIVGDIGGWVDGLVSATSGMNVEWAKIDTFDRSLNAIFGVLGITIMGGFAVRAVKAKKMGELMKSLWLVKKYLPKKMEESVQGWENLPEGIQSALRAVGVDTTSGNNVRRAVEESKNARWKSGFARFVWAEKELRDRPALETYLTEIHCPHFLRDEILELTAGHPERNRDIIDLCKAAGSYRLIMLENGISPMIDLIKGNPTLWEGIARLGKSAWEKSYVLFDRIPNAFKMVDWDMDAWHRIVALWENLWKDSYLIFWYAIPSLAPLFKSLPDRWLKVLEYLVILGKEAEPDNFFKTIEKSIPDIISAIQNRSESWDDIVRILNTTWKYKQELLCKIRDTGIVRLVMDTPGLVNDIVRLWERFWEDMTYLYKDGFSELHKLILSNRETWLQAMEYAIEWARVGKKLQSDFPWSIEMEWIEKVVTLAGGDSNKWRDLIRLYELSWENNSFFPWSIEHIWKIIDTGLISWDELIGLWVKAEKFSAGLFRSIIPDIIIPFLQRHPDQKWNILKLIEKVANRESDLTTIFRLQELDYISHFDDILIYYLENKQKSVIPLLQKLLSIKDLWLVTDFSGITRMLDLSWIDMFKPTEVSVVKTRLIESLRRLIEFSSIPWDEKRLKEIETYLRSVKTFDENARTYLKKHFADVFWECFNVVYERKIQIHMRAVLWDIVVGNEKAKEELFIEAFKMFQKADDNKEEFRKILIAYLRGDTKALWNSGENTAWLDKMFPRMFTGGNRETWLARNERVIDAGKASKVDVSKSIEHFLEVANRKLETLWLEPKWSAGDLLQYFDATLKKEKGSLREKSVNSEEFDTLFADLSLQVQSIKWLMRQGKAREITQVKIYRETNPMRTLMMGNWVDGSCLSFYSTVGNFWSTAVNALDANKAVFYIEDQAGNIIGRVLTAIDNNGNLLRFRTYTKGNIGIDLDAFINPYLRDIAERAWLGLNGNISQVELLHGTQWYQDPVQAM